MLVTTLASIRAIRGGFLRLRHLGVTDDEAGESEFTLFYRSPRIRATPLQPKSSKDQAAFLREFSPPYPALRDKPGVDKLLAHAERAPADIFATKPSDHKGLRAGQVAEIVHPKSRDKIVPVFIRSIGGNGWLLVVHGDGQESVVQACSLSQCFRGVGNAPFIALAKFSAGKSVICTKSFHRFWAMIFLPIRN